MPKKRIKDPLCRSCRLATVGHRISFCTPCKKVRQAVYRKTNVDKGKEAKKRWKARVREGLIEVPRPTFEAQVTAARERCPPTKHFIVEEVDMSSFDEEVIQDLFKDTMRILFPGRF